MPQAMMMSITILRMEGCMCFVAIIKTIASPVPSSPHASCINHEMIGGREQQVRRLKQEPKARSDLFVGDDE